VLRFEARSVADRDAARAEVEAVVSAAVRDAVAAPLP
jgi:phosphomannomutase/phosphoglucomutase